MKPAWVSFVALIVLVAGCTAPAKDPLGAVDPNQLIDALKLLDKKGFAIDQPVEVYLVGFEQGMGAKLAALLTPEEVAGAPLDFIINFPPTPEGLMDDGLGDPLPAIPRAVYRVNQLPDTFSHDFFDHVKAHPVPGASNTFDANAAEDFLAAKIPEVGHAWHAERPAFVILHAHDQLPAGHAWRFTYTNGYLEPVRAFGERHPFVVYDVSAKPDPYVTTNSMSPEAIIFRTVFGDNPTKDYNFPMDASGDATLAKLQELTIDATHYRLLQPAIYPVSTKPCHHVTLLMGVETASLTELADYGKSTRELVNVEALQSSFTNLTGDDVFVELKVLMLPQDDPALDAFMRTAANGAVIVFPFLDAMRWYLDQNWETYVTKKAGCEEYLSVMEFGDLATRGDFGGIGTYDVTHDRRISFSIWPELNRLRATWDGPAKDVIRTSSPSDDPWNRLNLLFSHETGHLFGQHHPQHLQHASGPSPSIDTFQSVWSVMSYETGMRVIDFGDIDTANWQRNRAGYTIQQAQIAGLETSVEFATAVAALKEYKWTDAHLALEGQVQHVGDGAAYHGGSSHEHPHLAEWFRGHPTGPAANL